MLRDRDFQFGIQTVKRMACRSSQPRECSALTDRQTRLHWKASQRKKVPIRFRRTNAHRALGASQQKKEKRKRATWTRRKLETKVRCSSRQANSYARTTIREDIRRCISEVRDCKCTFISIGVTPQSSPDTSLPQFVWLSVSAAAPSLEAELHADDDDDTMRSVCRWQNSVALGSVCAGLIRRK